MNTPQRNVGLSLLLGCLVAWPATRATAAPPDALKPVARHIHRIAQHNGDTTLAASMNYVFYGENPTAPMAGAPMADLRGWCDTLPADERYTIPECVVITDFDALKVAQMVKRGQMYKPGAARNVSEKWLDHYKIDPAAHRKALATADGRLMSKRRWAGVVDVIYNVDGIDRKKFPNAFAGGHNTLKRDKETGRFWGVWFNESGHYGMVDTAFHIMYVAPFSKQFKEIDTPPRGATGWRVEPSKSSDADHRLILTPIDPADPAAVGEHDFVLYVREDTLPASSTPFISVDPATLDDAGRALQQQLTMTLVANDGGVPFEKCLEAWHPNAHDSLSARNKQNVQYAAQGSRARVDLVSFGGVPPQAVPVIRLVSRVFTNEGIVWYGWAPSTGRPGPLDHYQPGPFGPGMTLNGEHIGVVQILQLRDADGVYRLTLPNTSDDDPENQLAMQILDAPDLAKAIIHKHLDME